MARRPPVFLAPAAATTLAPAPAAANLVLDPVKVLPHDHPAVGGDAFLVAAEPTGHPLVDLFFSRDRRALANLDNPRLLDRDFMDTYHPLLGAGPAARRRRSIVE